MKHRQNPSRFDQVLLSSLCRHTEIDSGKDRGGRKDTHVAWWCG